MAPRKGTIHVELVSCSSPETNISICFLEKDTQKKFGGPARASQNEQDTMAGPRIGTRRSTRLQSFAVEIPSRASNSSLSSPSVFSRGESAQSITDGCNTPATTVNPTPAESDSVQLGRPKRISASARAMELRNSSFGLGTSRTRLARNMAVADSQSESSDARQVLSRKRRTRDTIVEDSKSEGSDARLALELQAEEYGEDAIPKKRKVSQPITQNLTGSHGEGIDFNALSERAADAERAVQEMLGHGFSHQSTRDESVAYSSLDESDSALSDPYADLYNDDYRTDLTSSEDDVTAGRSFMNVPDEYINPQRNERPTRRIRRPGRLTRVSGIALF